MSVAGREDALVEVVRQGDGYQLGVLADGSYGVRRLDNGRLVNTFSDTHDGWQEALRTYLWWETDRSYETRRTIVVQHVKRRRRGLTSTAVAVVALAIALVAYRGANNVWPWSTYPSILHLCDRDFQPDGAAQTPSQIAAQGYHLVRHGDVPGWFNNAPVWKYDAVDGQPTQPVAGGCSVVLWVQGGPSTYQLYALLGGP